MNVLHSTWPIKTIKQMLCFCNIQTNLSSIQVWDKSFKSTAKLRNHGSVIFNFKIHTPPLLENNNSRSIVFANDVSIKCCVIIPLNLDFAERSSRVSHGTN
uniref:Uncharacterized protein n=1 Tax=Medicago truncatula TaxID=3880 RepID=I3SIR5_MEDTR|nr:unknown [Medicago truncatula]